MRIVTLLFLACAVTAACAQMKGDFPKDGNELLDSCSVAVDAADSPTSLSALSRDRFTEQMTKMGWCAGYLQATGDTMSAMQVRLYMIGKMGVTLSGPDKVKEYALDGLRGACIPEKAPIIQVARVVVKWLREHPERLHELKSVLTEDALKDAFPCTAPMPTGETVKPAPMRP